MVNDLNYEGIKFPFSKKDYCKIEKKNNICINVFCYENDLTYLVNVSDQKFKNCLDLLLIANENKSHYVYIKDFNRFMCNKTKNETKKYFCKFCLQCFSSEKVLQEHKGNCLVINGKQTVTLKSCSIEFKNYFKQLAILFKIYADFECLLKGVQSSDKNNSYTLKSIKIIFLLVLFTNLLVLVINLAEAIFKEYDYCKKNNKKVFY